MDLMMPKLDGISATKRIRNQHFESYLPIIVITAKVETNDMVSALDAGADDYITKPFELEEIHARIRNMLRLKKLQDRLMHKTNELDDANQQITRLNHVLVNTNKQLQKKIYDFHNLFEISYRVMGQLELRQLINQALLNLLGIIATQSVILLVANKEDNDIFEVIDSKGFKEDTLDNFTLYRHDKLIHYLEIIKKPFQINNVSKDFREIVPALERLKVQVVAPLFKNEEIFGLLCIGPNIKDVEYNEDNIETLAIMTNMLAIALYNAQMYQSIETLSYTDGMTGLHNYRFFRLRLKEEIARTRRENSYVSLSIIDVDHFKNYNDQLGHPAGDEVLRKISRILKNSVRDNDIVARYGGEEFAIILPGTDETGAFSLAERIRRKVEGAPFSKQEIQPEGNITISAGIATYPLDAVIIDDLIIAADRALYHAKYTGRNKVIKAKEVLEST
jgi:two-component system cell cycle response regulator